MATVGDNDADRVGEVFVVFVDNRNIDNDERSIRVGFDAWQFIIVVEKLKNQVAVDAGGFGDCVELFFGRRHEVDPAIGCGIFESIGALSCDVGFIVSKHILLLYHIWLKKASIFYKIE